MAEGKGTKRGRSIAPTLVVLGTLGLLVTGLAPDAVAETEGRIEGVALESSGGSTKVVISLSRSLIYDVRELDADPAKKIGRRLVVDFADATLAPEAAKPVAATSDVVRNVRTGQFNAHVARVVIELAGDAPHAVDASDSPPRVTVSLGGAATAAAHEGPTTAAVHGGAVAPVPPPPAAAASDLPPPVATGGSAPAPAAVGNAPADVPAAPVAAASPAAPSDAAKQTASSGSTTQSPPRKIPIRARGRRPYYLLYAP